MTDISIFYSTVHEVPPGLEEQANDLDKVLELCRQYMKEWGCSAKNLVNDLELIL